MTRRMQGKSPNNMIVLPVLIPFIGAAVGCADSTPPPSPPAEEWAAICVDPRNPADPNDDVRLDDDACGDFDDDGDGGHSSYFFLWNSSTYTAHPVPATGRPLSGYGGHRHFPPGSYAVTKLPPAGAPNLKQAAAAPGISKVQRGGLGVPAGAGKAGGSAGG